MWPQFSHGFRKHCPFVFCPSFSCYTCNCNALSGSLHFQGGTGNINCFLRVVVFPRDDFRARNEEEGILSSLFLSSLTQEHPLISSIYFQPLQSFLQSHFLISLFWCLFTCIFLLAWVVERMRVSLVLLVSMCCWWSGAMHCLLHHRGVPLPGGSRVPGARLWEGEELLTVPSAQSEGRECRCGFHTSGSSRRKAQPSVAPLSPSSPCACVLGHYEGPLRVHTHRARPPRHKWQFQKDLIFCWQKRKQKWTCLAFSAFFFKKKIEIIFIDCFLATKVL